MCKFQVFFLQLKAFKDTKIHVLVSANVHMKMFSLPSKAVIGLFSSSSDIQKGNSEQRCKKNVATGDLWHLLVLDIQFGRIQNPDSLGIDLLAGVEAVISHLVLKHFQIPCAHAPALSPPQLSTSVCPKLVAEEIGHTFLPCVLDGLGSAPQYLIKGPEILGKNYISASDVDSDILPIDACGGDGALAFASRKRKKGIILWGDEKLWGEICRLVDVDYCEVLVRFVILK